MRMMFGLPVSFRSTYETGVEQATNRDAARIPIEKFGGKGLLFAGTQDAMWQGNVAAQHLAERNKGLRAVLYDDAGHVFFENMDELGRSWPIMCGGTLGKATGTPRLSPTRCCMRS